MTGYGIGQVSEYDRQVKVEVKSVNGKFLDTSIKMQKNYMLAEDNIRRLVASRLYRGNVEVFVTVTYVEGSETRKVVCDQYSARTILRDAQELASKLSVEQDLKISDILKFDGVISFVPSEEDLDGIHENILMALNDALDWLCKMREKEGASLKRDLTKQITKLAQIVDEIEKNAPLAIQEYRQKLTDRIKDALKEVTIDESKLVNEIAFFADKADINEEVVRLRSHISQFTELLKSRKAVGRQLEFLTQEMLREVNTTGSKSSSINITNLVLSAKNIIETIKEQIRNVE